MAVTNFFGKTESGKSYRAGEMAKTYDRSIIFDNARCFKEGDLITDKLNPKALAEIMRRFALKDKYRIVLRPSIGSDPKEQCDLVARWLLDHWGAFNERAKILGRTLFVVDEADKVSPEIKSSALYRMITMGRHRGFDTYGISQGPGRLPRYWRENASEVITFKGMEHEFFKQLFGSNASMIQTLNQYESMCWKDTGEMRLMSKDWKPVKILDL